MRRYLFDQTSSSSCCNKSFNYFHNIKNIISCLNTIPVIEKKKTVDLNFATFANKLMFNQTTDTLVYNHSCAKRLCRFWFSVEEHK